MSAGSRVQPSMNFSTSYVSQAAEIDDFHDRQNPPTRKKKKHIYPDDACQINAVRDTDFFPASLEFHQARISLPNTGLGSPLQDFSSVCLG